MNNIGAYVFHYNQYTNLWAAFKNDQQQSYWDKMYPHDGSTALFAQDISMLFDLIAFQKPTAGDTYKRFGLEEPNVTGEQQENS